MCLGYKGNVIKDYFLNYNEAASNDLVWSQGGKNIRYLNRDLDDWRITFVDTGANANVGQRLKAVEPHLQNEEAFLANYGDGLSDLELPLMIDDFRKSKAVASLLLVQPTASFHIVSVDGDGAVSGISALTQSGIWINGGFFVMSRKIFEYMNEGEELVHEPFQRLVERKALLAYKCRGFWQCMDTFKDKQALDELEQTTAPWKVWNQKTDAAASNSDVMTIRA